jgi:adenylate kinase family enzyme
MLEPLAERTVIIGNSGSGKSTLAEAIASLVHIPVIDLDLLHWEQDGYGAKRNEDVARQMALDVSNQRRWIIEGVFGWLAEVALPNATALVWLDFRGVFAVPGYSLAGYGEEQPVGTPPT